MFFIFFLSFFFSFNLFSQQEGEKEKITFNGVVFGRVIEEKTKQSLPYANILLIKEKDSTIVDGTITDDFGKFKLDKVKPGRYLIKVHFLGFEIKIINFVLTPKNPVIDLGNIELKPSITALKEIDVIEEKPQYEFKLDKKIINVSKDIVNSGGSLLDVLRNTPMIEVDMDNNILLRGNSNVKILINGKPSVLFSGTEKGNIMEQFPINTIERIEIITNPSAKYDPEGSAGIINIITKENRIKNLINAQFSLSYGTFEKFNPNINLGYSKNFFSTFFNYSFRTEDRKGYRKQERTFFENDTFVSYQKIFSDRKSNMFSHNFRNSYEFDLGKNFSAIINGALITTKRKINEVTEYNVLNNKKFSYGNNFVFNYDLNFSLKKKFKERENELNFDVYYSNSLDDRLTNFEQLYIISTEEPLKGEISDIYVHKNLTTQLDYVNKINENNKIEAGLKYQKRFMKSDYNYYKKETYLRVLDTNKSNIFDFTDNIYSSYFTYGRNISSFNFLIGIRYEFTQLEGNQKRIDCVFNKHYHNLFPTIHLNYDLGKNNIIQLSYSKRINRPNPHSYDPFIDKSQILIWHSGNKDLNPEISHSYELSYLKNWEHSSISSSVFYKFTDDVITRYRTVKTIDDTVQVIHVFPINMNKQENFGSEFILSKSFFRFIRTSLNFSAYQQNLNGYIDGEFTKSKTFTYTIRFNSFILLPKEFSIQFNGFFNGPQLMANAVRLPFYSINFGIKKDFFNKKFSVSIRASDIFNTMKFRVKTEDKILSGNMEFKRETRIVFVSLSYNFKETQNIKEQRKKEKATEIDMGDELF
mgnify:CR=1 FL=1